MVVWIASRYPVQGSARFPASQFTKKPDLMLNNISVHASFARSNLPLAVKVIAKGHHTIRVPGR